jgi:hypothetical protein
VATFDISSYGSIVWLNSSAFNEAAETSEVVDSGPIAFLIEHLFCVTAETSYSVNWRIAAQITYPPSWGESF